MGAPQEGLTHPDAAAVLAPHPMIANAPEL